MTFLRTKVVKDRVLYLYLKDSIPSKFLVLYVPFIMLGTVKYEYQWKVRLV